MLDERSPDRLIEILTGRVVAMGVPPEGARELAAGFVATAAQEHVEGGGRPGSLGLMIRHYVIRKDDLALFDAVTSALRNAVGTKVLMGTAPTTAAQVGIGISLLKLFRDLLKKGAVLGSNKILILTILRTGVASSSSPGLTEEEILAAVNSSGAQKDIDWLQQQLRGLSKFPVPDGSTKEFASQDGLGRWRAHV